MAAKLLEFSLILPCRVAAGHQEGLGVCKEPVGRTCRGGEGRGWATESAGAAMSVRSRPHHPVREL